METKFKGIYPVVLTPFLEDGTVDVKCLKWTVNYLIEKKVSGLVILGSSSEGPYLTLDEKKQVINVVSSEIQNRLQLIVGIISYSTEEAILLGNFAKDKGADAILTALSVYFPVKFEDVYSHYDLISKRVGLPILYYNFPSKTHLHLKPKNIAKLFEIENIVGMKDSELNVKMMKKKIHLIRKPISLFCGSSLILLKTLQIGGAGCICPIPLLIPDIVTSLYNAFLNNDYKIARRLQDKIFDNLPVVAGKKLSSNFVKKLINIAIDAGITLKGEFQIALFKEALRLAGHPIKPIVKPPLPQLSEEQKMIAKEYFALS